MEERYWTGWVPLGEETGRRIGGGTKTLFSEQELLFGWTEELHPASEWDMEKRGKERSKKKCRRSEKKKVEGRFHIGEERGFPPEASDGISGRKRQRGRPSEIEERERGNGQRCL